MEAVLKVFTANDKDNCSSQFCENNSHDTFTSSRGGQRSLFENKNRLMFIMPSEELCQETTVSYE